MPRLNRVQIRVDDTLVDLTWQLSIELRGRLAQTDRKDLAARFAAAGTSRPIRLNREDVEFVRSLLEDWEREIGGAREQLARIRHIEP